MKLYIASMSHKDGSTSYRGILADDRSHTVLAAQPTAEDARHAFSLWLESYNIVVPRHFRTLHYGEYEKRYSRQHRSLLRRILARLFG